jgi:hypothetical protein
VAEAVAARGEQLAAVGGEAEVMRLAGEGTWVVDAGGRLVIPGLNDSHLHAIRSGLQFTGVALGRGRQPGARVGDDPRAGQSHAAGAVGAALRDAPDSLRQTKAPMRQNTGYERPCSSRKSDPNARRSADACALGAPPVRATKRDRLQAQRNARSPATCCLALS